MNRLRRLLTAGAFVLALSTPFLTGAMVQAADVRLDGLTNLDLPLPVVECPTTSGGEFPEVSLNQSTCDLGLTKQVSVNGGAFVEADTSSAAASAAVGSTVVWKIIVTNHSPEGQVPHGTVYIQDILPAGVNFVSYSASAGGYHTADGTFFQNDWYLPLLTSDGDSFVTSLPATLTITTTATVTGLVQNTAAFVKYDNGHQDGGVPYADPDPSNNTNDAWIRIQTPPQVLADSTTLVATGSGTVASYAAGVIVLTTLAVGSLGRSRKSYKL